MDVNESGAKVPPVGQNIGQGKSDGDNKAGLKVLQELRASVKDSEDDARLGLGKTHLPIDGFNPELREIMNNVAWDYDVHRDKCVLAAMEAVAMVTGYKVSATLDFVDYENCAMLLGLVVDVSGGGKSTVNRFFMKPVENLNAKAKRRYQKAKREFNELPLDQQKGAEKPYPDLLVTNNYTAERLVQLDNTSSTGVSFYRDEMSGFYRSIGKYSSSGKSDVIEQQLTLADGRLEANDRVSDGDELTETKETAFSMFGTIQPDVFDEFFVPLIQSKNGYFNRFNYVFTEPRKRRHLDCYSKIKSDPKVWEAFINSLTQIPSGTVYTYDAAAGFRFTQFINEHVIDVYNKDLYSEDYFTSYLTRNTRAILRMAIIIHVMNDWRSSVITEKEMKMAIEMQETFNEYAKKLLARVPCSSRSKETDESPAELIKAVYRRNNAKGKPASFVNQSNLATMIGVTQAYVNKIKASMIRDGEISDDDSKEDTSVSDDAVVQAPEQAGSQTSEPEEIQDSETAETDLEISETPEKSNEVVPEGEGSLESQDSPTPSVPPKIRSGDDSVGGDTDIMPDDGSGGSTS